MPNQSTTVRTQDPILLNPGYRLLLFLLADDRAPLAEPALVAEGGAPFESTWHRLTDRWSVVEARRAEPWTADRLEFVAPASALLTDIHVRTGDTGERILFQPNATRRVTFEGRWARTRAHFLAPSPRTGQASLFLLLNAPDALGATTEFSVRSEHRMFARQVVHTGHWSWQVWPITGREHAGGLDWFALSAHPPWNPGLDHYPEDLAARLGCVAVVSHDH